MPTQNCRSARHLNTTPILVVIADGSSLVPEGIRR